MWIGLEGCDGVGKSSLAEAIRDELENRFGAATLIHRGPPERSTLEEYATDIEGRENEHLVFDRWHLGQLVYAPLYRGTGPYGDDGIAAFRWIEKFLEARGTVFWTVDLDYETVAARLSARGEDYLQSHHVEQVLERYREVNDESVLTHDYTLIIPDGLESVASTAADIVDRAVKSAEPYKVLRAFPSYVGGCLPNVLLVGERRGGQPPFISQSCFMAVPNRSGEFLWESLTEDVWRVCGAVNAYEDDVASLWEELGKPTIVALGGQASVALGRSKLPHAIVPHPQWVKRFKNKEQAAYGELIALAAESGTEHFAWRS